MIHVAPALIAPVPVPAQSSPIGGSGGEAAEGGRPKVRAPTNARALIEDQLAMLTRLAQVGMEIAEACGRQAQAAPIEAGLAFARVARAVRMTIALQSRLAKDLAALDRAEEMADKARTARRRMRLSQLVEDAARAKIDAQREAGARFWADEDAIEDEIERLSTEAYERLTDAEDGDLSGLPFHAAVAAICADLGLSADWTARLAAATAAPLTSPTRSVAGGGPSAEEPRVEGEGQGRCGPRPSLRPAPSTAPSHRVASRPGPPLASQATPSGGGLGAGPPPAIATAMGEVATPPRAPP